jgi:tetratricopeptide (TPR) repeat protein
MRKSLQEYQDYTDRKDTHQFLLVYYSNKLEDIDIKAITPEHEKALTEAFYHAKESLEAEDLFKWFISVSNLYYKAAFWQLIIPLYEKILQILEAEPELGPEHPYVATTLNNLAELYRHMENYEKALPLYQRALEISKNVFGPQHPNVVTTLNNLAELSKNMGDYEKALPLYQRALEIYENALGPQHPDVATTLDNLAGLYRAMGNYEKALLLNQRALEIYENILGPQHPNTINIRNNSRF